MGKNKIGIISLIIYIGFICALSFHSILGYLKLGYPYNTFLFTPNDRFMDFANIYYVTKNLDPFHNFPFGTYFPFAIIFEYAWTFLPLYVSFPVYMFIFLSFFALYNHAFLVRKNVGVELKDFLIISFFSYPLLFALDRGNMEMYMYIFLSLFIFFYYYKKNYIVGVVFLSFAIASKLFPAVFLVLLLKNKKYKEIILAIMLVAIITVIPLFLIKGTLSDNLADFLKTLINYSQGYVIGRPGVAPGLGFGHSLFGVLRLFLQKTDAGFYFSHISSIMKAYLVFSLVCFSAVAAYILFIEKTFWKQVALLVFSFNLLPYVSADYKLLHVFIPMLLFIDSNEKSPFNFPSAVLFGLLLVPKAYYHFTGIVTESNTADISVSIIINPLLMLGFSMVIVYEGIRNHRAARFAPRLRKENTF